MSGTGDISFLIDDANAQQSTQAASSTQEQHTLDIQYMLRHLLRLKEEIDALEEKLADTKKLYNKINQYDLPDLFAQARIKSLTLLDDDALYDVKVKADLSVTITNQAKLVETLSKYGAGAVIKSTITLPKLSPDMICKLQNDIQKNYNIDVEVTNSVHPQTLKKLVKELTTGDAPCATIEDLQDCLRIYKYNVTNVKKQIAYKA